MVSCRFPPWLVKRMPSPSKAHSLKALMRQKRLFTVCEEARCPNLFECFSRGTATFMIGGDICTRTCGYCAVTKGLPDALDADEPRHVAEAAFRLKLNHVVVTMVNRDDLSDGASGHVVSTIEAIRECLPDTTIEVLVSDFMGDAAAVEKVVRAKPDVFNHNMETVSRLFKKIRPNGNYERSLQVLAIARELDPAITTKSGIMVGLRETEEDVLSLMDDLRDPRVDCQIMTIGQYLQPKKKALLVREYIHPDTFERYRKIGEEKGFAFVFAGPFVRSSYNAMEAMHAAQGVSDESSPDDPEGRSFMTADRSGRNIPVSQGSMVSLYP